MDTEKPLTLAKRILAIMAELPYVQKKKAVSFGNTNYRAVAYEDLAAEVQPLLVKHGVLIIPSLVDLSTEMFESNGRSTMAAIVKMQFTVMNADDAGDCINLTMPGVGYDTSDKAVGKATTYAEKDALRKLFVVPSGEEPEDDHIERATAKREAPAAPATGQPQVKPPPTPSQKAHDAAVNRALLQSISGLGHHEWTKLTPEEANTRGEATKEQLSYLWKLLTAKHPSFKAKDFHGWIVAEFGEDKKWVEEMWQMGAVLAGECIAKLAPKA